MCHFVKQMHSVVQENYVKPTQGAFVFDLYFSNLLQRRHALNALW